MRIVAAVDPDDVERPGSDRDDYADWKAAKDDTSEAFKRAAAQAGRKEDFVVGATPLDEKMLSRVMLQLLNNHARGIPAAPFLDKIKDDMCLDGYKSVLVGIGRTRQWALAREIVDWVRRQGLEQGKAGAARAHVQLVRRAHPTTSRRRGVGGCRRGLRVHAGLRRRTVRGVHRDVRAGD